CPLLAHNGPSAQLVLTASCCEFNGSMQPEYGALDGYIARQDDDIDWPLKRDNPTEDHGYAAFISEKITGGRSDGY
ncbi:hypothetical protein LZ641_11790, partial [Hafnia paralvei]|nr:hypothetical protein [Hafnia paralvei]MCE9907656.1 hypothetical protein [Hafnia paralvei]